MADLMEDNDMIQDILSRSFATPEGLDEGDLESELESLGDEVCFFIYYYHLIIILLLLLLNGYFSLF